MTALRTRIKFCGLTRALDLRAAVELGVDAIGLVCVPGSRRELSIEAAAALRREVPALVSCVLLLSDADEDLVRRALDSVQPDCVQFHGRESPEFCAQFGRRYFKAVAVRSAADVTAAAQEFKTASALLLDSHSADGMGGTGRTFDWTQIPRDVDVPLILAGGLNPDNVAGAIRMAAPYAVDVSSGIESAPGRKDSDRMRAFVDAVRRADSER